jgi:site-specific DNA-methyltransferase (cytosine-N4-specific)
MSEDSPFTDLLDSEAAYSTKAGSAFLGDSRDLLKELPDDSIDLIVTSPPFYSQHQKECGNEDQESYNDWFMQFIPEIRRVLQPHGSLIVEIGGAFKKGNPERSTYQFELLSRIVDEGEMYLAQDFYSYNPAKLPNPIEWVNVRNIRVTDAVAHIWWLTPEINEDSAIVEGEHPHPEANNQRVLQDYSETQEQLMETGECNDSKRSSGRDIDESSFANKNEGSVPDNLLIGSDGDILPENLDEVSADDFLKALTGGADLDDMSVAELFGVLEYDMNVADSLIEISNTTSNTHYLRMCREFDFDSHPARFPRQIPEFFIDFLTPSPPYDDWDHGVLDRPIVLDIFGGSNITGKIAESKGRHWLAFERDEKYLETSQFRFLEEEQIRKRLNEDQIDFGDFAKIGKND